VNESEQLHAAAGGDNAEGDAISLRPYFDTLRRYRNVIRGALLAVSGLFLVGVLALLMIFPAERVASIQFRLLFDGAAQNQYPNKTPFSPTEIVGPPVIAEVFEKNDLQRYGKYESFKNALFVQQSNPKLDLLAYEYQAKLADTKLNPVDRARIEAEFSQKREALTDPSFSLSLRRSERFRALPDDLAEKVLNDTLAAWAVQAERMGAMKYELPVLSSAAVLSKESLDSEDYLVAADQLRAKAVRIINTLAELERVPGALTIRTSKGGVSLPEIRANIEDALRFELEPLLGIIRSEGITKNARLLSLYASTQVFQLTLEKQAAQGRAIAVQNSLADYMTQRGGRTGADVKAGAAGSTRQPGFDTPALIPQFGESFLDRLVEMSASTQKSEMEYRQKLTDMVIAENLRVASLEKELAYYQDLAKAAQGIGNRAAGSADLVKLITQRSQRAFAIIAKGADQLVDLYTELSAQNLNPVARLYAVTGPFTRQTQWSLSFRSVALSYVLVLLLTLILVPVGCLIHNAMKPRRAA
jgi:hypothetical protein